VPGAPVGLDLRVRSLSGLSQPCGCGYFFGMTCDEIVKAYRMTRKMARHLEINDEQL